MRESIADRRQRERACTSGGELDRERQAVEATGDLGDHREVIGCGREVRTHEACAIEEQPHRVRRLERRELGAPPRNREWRHLVFLLARDPQRRTACRKHAQIRAR
jgi:hypothetical protein